MAPPRKSRSVHKRYSYLNEVSPNKDEDATKRNSSRKRKLADMLGPRWTMEELTHFYDSYRKNGKDWKKVAGAVRNRSPEMAEALYSMNRAYLSLPHGTASAAGLTAMMTDHYSNLAGSDSDQESNDGVGSSRKTQKRARGKLPAISSKASDEQLVSNSPTIASSYGCMLLLKKKRSGGSFENLRSRYGNRPRPVGKRTPRFPVSFSYENTNAERYSSRNKQGLKLDDNAAADEVAHRIAIALTEASQRGGSPLISGIPSKIAESVMSSPFRLAQRKHSVAETANAKLLPLDMYEEDVEGSTEADTGELLRSGGDGTTRQKGGKFEGKNVEDIHIENHLNDIKEECSATEEGNMFDAMRSNYNEVNDAKVYRSSTHSKKKKSKKALFRKDEGPTFDALQALADLSLMMPTENEDESKMQLKDENQDHVDESVPVEAPPVNRPREKRRSSGVRMKGHLLSNSEAALSKTSKPRKGLSFDVSSVLEDNQDSHQSITKTARKKQKMQALKTQKKGADTVADTDVHGSESPGIEVGDLGSRSMSKTKKSSQSGSPKLIKISENSSIADERKEGSDSAQSAEQITVSNQDSLLTKARSRRKMNLKKPHVQKDVEFPQKILNDQIYLPETAISFKEKLSNCLSNQHLRRWCSYEWFYSAIDYPWFAKREFDEYLYHVGLGHVPRLTRMEWSVIRSSLGKPRRFSEHFMKEEKEKLNQYRNSVRKHYTELREGAREGLPTDLAKPVSVGQRVIAIHPRTREIHDGSVLTVDHSKCRVQFDRHELGVEFVMDVDCMPINPFENMPAMFGRRTAGFDRLFENFNELKTNGQAKEYFKLSPSDNPDNIDSTIHLSPFANQPGSLKLTKVSSANVNGQARYGFADATNYPQAAHSQPNTPSQIQAKEADVQALAELTRALDKKEAIVVELRRMNDDVLGSQQDGDSPLKDAEPFKKQYAAVLIQLNEANEQVSSALHCLRERNTYQGKRQLLSPATNPTDNRVACQTDEAGSHVNEIMDSSRTKARTMVNAAIQAISSLKSREDTTEKIEEAIDYINERLPSDDSCTPVMPDQKFMNPPEVEAQIPSDLISKCIATLLMIQKCTERQFPPSDVAQILDSAVTSLQPRSSQNLPVYSEIQKCVGVIKNQILALIPT